MRIPQRFVGFELGFELGIELGFELGIELVSIKYSSALSRIDLLYFPSSYVASLPLLIIGGRRSGSSCAPISHKPWSPWFARLSDPPNTRKTREIV